MRAGRTIDAFFREHQPFNRLPVHDVRLDDLIDICRRHAPIPDRIRINHHGGAMLALVEASRHVSPNPLLESSKGQFLLEEELKLGLPGGIATATRVSRFPLITADEQMPLELGHENNLQDSKHRCGIPKALGSRFAAARLAQSFSVTIAWSFWQKVATRFSPPWASVTYITGP